MAVMENGWTSTLYGASSLRLPEVVVQGVAVVPEMRSHAVPSACRGSVEECGRPHRSESIGDGRREFSRCRIFFGSGVSRM